MPSYNEKDHPRDPLGKFSNKLGASAASGVSLAEDRTPERLASVVRDINANRYDGKDVVALDVANTETVAHEKRSGCNIVRGTVWGADREEKALYSLLTSYPARKVQRSVTFPDSTSFSSETAKGPDGDIRIDDIDSTKGFVQRWFGARQGRPVTEYSFRLPEGDENGDDIWVYSRDDGNFDMQTYDEDYTTEILTQSEVDERFGQDCPLHSESNIDQTLDENAAFLRGEADTYHKDFS